MKPVKVVLHLYFDILIFTVDNVERENVNHPNTLAIGETVLNLPIHHWQRIVLNFQSSIKVLGFLG